MSNKFSPSNSLGSRPRLDFNGMNKSRISCLSNEETQGLEDYLGNGEESLDSKIDVENFASI